MLDDNQIEQIKEKILNRLGNIERKGMQNVINYLTKHTDYFTCPASTRFHNNFKGGLALHSDYVTELLLEKNKRYNLGLSEESIYIAGYLHDICKCNMYEEGYKLTKENGNWVSEKSYIIQNDLPLGHGAKSIILIQQLMKLTKEESLLIYWHMGPYAQTQDNNYELNEAIKQCKAIVAMYTSDMEAANLLEIVVEPERGPASLYNEYINRKKKEKEGQGALNC